nr:hypothetical protein BgiMline_027787 [Biomphalaria glabrata]
MGNNATLKDSHRANNMNYLFISKQVFPTFDHIDRLSTMSHHISLVSLILALNCALVYLLPLSDDAAGILPVVPEISIEDISDETETISDFLRNVHNSKDVSMDRDHSLELDGHDSQVTDFLENMFGNGRDNVDRRSSDNDHTDDSKEPVRGTDDSKENKSTDKDHDDSKDKEHDNSKDKDHDNSRDKDNDNSKDKDHNNSRDKDNDNSKDKDHDNSRDKDNDNSKDKDHDNSRDKDNDNSKDKDHDNSRDKDSNNSKDNDNSKDKDHNNSRDKDNDNSKDKDHDNSKDKDSNNSKDNDNSKDKDQDNSKDKDQDNSKDDDTCPANSVEISDHQLTVTTANGCKVVIKLDGITNNKQFNVQDDKLNDIRTILLSYDD